MPPPTTDHQPPANDLLRYLVAVGLVTEERAAPNDQNPTLSCHELVRERIHARMDAGSQERANLSENSIRLAYAERLIAAFQALENQNMPAALQAGSRALFYCVQAVPTTDWALSPAASSTTLAIPVCLNHLCPLLKATINSAPEGRLRWSCLCYLADALWRAGRPDDSLPFYEQAAAQARAAATAGQGAQQAWADLGWIIGNWANALGDIGDLNTARQRLLESAEAKKKAGRPAINIIGSELEALRIEIMQGRMFEALPQVEERLAQVKSWWQQHRTGQACDRSTRSHLPRPHAPQRGSISPRVSILPRKIMNSRYYGIDEMLAVRHALQLPAEEIARDRMNRANVLGGMRRFSEAQAEMEDCLQLFQHDPARRARVFSSLADLFDEQGDVDRAIAQERHALALREQLPDPRDRAISHNNLAYYFERSGAPPELAESPRHQLAALIYRRVAGLEHSLQFSLHNYGVLFLRAHAAGALLLVPRVATLLANPAFRPLDDWLRQQQVNEDELQADVDQLLEQARQAALAGE